MVFVPEKNTGKSSFQRSNTQATGLLVLPVLLGAVLILTLDGPWYLYGLGQVAGGLFFTQAQILLHEFGHRSMFRSDFLNRSLASVFSVLVLIPRWNWTQIHDLHHRWTGYRDKDPTTEKTFAESLTPFQMKLVNFCWRFHIPLFTLGYRFGIYWNLEKLKRHLPASSYRKCVASMVCYGAFYGALAWLFPWTCLALVPALYISFVVCEIITLSQHSQIRMLDSKGSEVRPLRFAEQSQYSRSLILPPLISRLLLFNFNHHEAHHASPGRPCYRLAQVPVTSSNAFPFWSWARQAKSMGGVDLVFRSNSNRANF